MERIHIQNLRCLVDTPSVEIKPITILVGANSSGKSTFLRVFPLLKQSVETKTLSGILLNDGDVNFGFFREAVHKDANPPELRFGFSLHLKPGIYQGAYANRFLTGALPVTCNVRFVPRSKDPRYPFLKSVRLTLEKGGGKDSIEIGADEDGKVVGFRVNDYKANGEVSHLRLKVGRGIVPTLANNPTDVTGGMRPLEDEDEDDFLDAGPFERKLLSETSYMFHGNMTRTNRLATLRSLRLDTPTAMLDRAKKLDGGASWRQHASHWSIIHPRFVNVRNLVIAKHVGDILSGISRYVIELSESVHYFQPVRASVQRDYTSRDVQVGRVDPSGSNVAMMLTNLTPGSLTEFRSWLLRHFAFEVYPVTIGDGARVAIRMREKGTDAEFNLADMGFGFSQMLPFLVQIWYLVEYEPRHGGGKFRPDLNGSLAIPKSFIVAIEQPELHLHPMLQSKLADLFVAVVKVSREKGLPVRFVLETHSPTIIERIGAHVEAQAIAPKDVQVLLFEREMKDGKSNIAKVRSTGYDEEGVLKDWPFGFLAPPSTPIAPVKSKLVNQ